MAEIEHFCDPTNKSHPKFSEIEHLKLPLYSAPDQEAGHKNATAELTVHEALDKQIFGNETMAYFVARTYLFLTSVGIREDAIRFRQHRANEMAHYANDCWDAEVETSYGWIEVAGHSDRSAFDLERHQAKTKVELTAGRPLKNPIQVTSTIVSLEKKVLGKEFKKDQSIVVKYFDDLDNEAKAKLAEQFKADGSLKIEAEGKEFTLTSAHVSFSEQTKTVIEEKFVPHVIEPSYGIGRIVYCVFEHCFKVREQDAQRTYFDFPPAIAPVKCSLLPLQGNADLNAKVTVISKCIAANSFRARPCAGWCELQG